ncbi:MAG: TAXI family TRAP transporter solute-binding subunit [Pseudomonadota bacterium]
MKRWVKLLYASATISLAAVAPAMADDVTLTYASAPSSSAYYKMGKQIAEALKAGSNGEISMVVNESEDYVDNVMQATEGAPNHMFSSHPVLVHLAQEGKAMFAGKGNGAFEEIRALFPIPSLTMQFVMEQEAAVLEFDQLKGKKILLDNGTFAAREAAKYIKLFGLEGDVSIVDADLSEAETKLKNGDIDGFAIAGSWPTPEVSDIAMKTTVNLVTMTDDQVEKTKRARIVIPKGTYGGQDDDIVTTSLPVVVYTTKAMDDETAYLVTKTFWEQMTQLRKEAGWWKGVDDTLMTNISGRLHPGSIKFYKEVGFPIAEDQQ